MGEQDVVRVRAVDGDLIGTTAFFRNRAFLDRLAAEIAAFSTGGRTVEILVHACSIGAEVYSLAMRLLADYPSVDFRIDATDISPSFVQFAAAGVYPEVVLTAFAPAERAFLTPGPDGKFAVGDAVRARVNFLPPASFVDFTPDRSYDIVTLCNALIYVPAQAQARALAAIGRYNRRLLALTGGHKTTIADDLAKNGYQPITADFAAIHAGWTDRFRDPAMKQRMMLPPTIHADPFMDPIDDAPGWQFRHGALFRKQAAAKAA